MLEPRLEDRNDETVHFFTHNICTHSWKKLSLTISILSFCLPEAPPPQRSSLPIELRYPIHLFHNRNCVWEIGTGFSISCVILNMRSKSGLRVGIGKPHVLKDKLSTTTISAEEDAITLQHQLELVPSLAGPETWSRLPNVLSTPPEPVLTSSLTLR